jgi:hypothetical protein
MELLDKLAELKHVSIYSPEIERTILDYMVEHKICKLEEPLKVHIVFYKKYYIMGDFLSGVMGYITNHSLIMIISYRYYLKDYSTMYGGVYLYNYSAKYIKEMNDSIVTDERKIHYPDTSDRVYDDVTFEMFLPKSVKSARTCELI